jgi:hypothetical protein
VLAIFMKVKSMNFYPITPAGERGGMYFEIGRLTVAIGWARDVRGFDVVWNGRFLIECSF